MPPKNLYFCTVLPTTLQRIRNLVQMNYINWLILQEKRTPLLEAITSLSMYNNSFERDRQRERENVRLTDAEKLADFVDSLARLSDVVFIAYYHYLFTREDTQPVGQERVIHADAHPNLQHAITDP